MGFLDWTDDTVICCLNNSCFAPRKAPLEDLKCLKTGDLMLARSNPTGRIPGLHTLTSSAWDHVGLVWVHNDEIYIIDSGSFRYYKHLCTRPLHFDKSAPCKETWKMDADGPQMYPLAAFLEAQGRSPLEVHAGKIPWHYELFGFRPLTKPLTEDQLVKLTAAVEKYADLPYQKEEGEAVGEMMRATIDTCDCFGSCFGIGANLAEDRKTLFCRYLHIYTRIYTYAFTFSY